MGCSTTRQVLTSYTVAAAAVAAAAALAAETGTTDRLRRLGADDRPAGSHFTRLGEHRDAIVGIYAPALQETDTTDIAISKYGRLLSECLEKMPDRR